MFWKYTMQGFLLCEKRDLEWSLDNVGFVPNLNTNAENLPCIMWETSKKVPLKKRDSGTF